MTAPLPAPFGPAGQDDAAARDALADRLDEWDTAQLRLALQAVIPALTPGQVFGLAAVLGLCDRWAGDIAGRAPAVAPAGNGRGEPPELDGSARTTPQEPDRGAAVFAGNPTDPRHGTLNGYSNLRCRCPRCKDAWSAYGRARREARPKLADDDPRHGSHAGYTNWRCRCAECRAGHAAYNRSNWRSRRAAEAS